jgi:hypothetical protein
MVESRAYVVSRPYEDSNVGSNLASLAGAAWLARRLGRDLIVDWRGMSQLQDKSLNYFSEFFAAPSELTGVRTLYAPVDGVAYEQSRADAAWLAPPEARGVSAAGRADPPYLVLQPYHGLDRIHDGSESERFRHLRSFYREIRPAPRIEAELDRWAADHFDGAFVVGVNVRTGNGQYFGRGMPYASRVDVSIFENGRRFMRLLGSACRRCTRRLPRPLRDDFVMFYATDSAPMSELLAGLPNAVTRRRVFPPPGTGDLYAFEDGDYTDRDAIEDTLADMFLLARCDALVYNSSLFNQYARIVTGCFGGNQLHIETLFLRHRMRWAWRAVRRRLR